MSSKEIYTVTMIVAMSVKAETAEDAERIALLKTQKLGLDVSAVVKAEEQG